MPSCTIPLWLVFSLQSLVVMVSFIAVILVLVLQQQDQYKSSVFEKINLQQQRSEYTIMSPITAREGRFKQLSDQFQQSPDMWYTDTMSQATSPALQRFFNFTYFLCRNDPLVYSVYQHLRHSNLTHANGDPIYGIAAMNDGLLTIQSHWDSSNLATAFIHPTYPLTYTTSIVSSLAVSQDVFSYVLRSVTSPRWGLGTIVYNSLNGATTVVTGLLYPVIVDPITQQANLSFVHAFNVSYMTETVQCSPQTANSYCTTAFPQPS